MRKPFFWKARGAWYVQVKQPNGKYTPKKLHEDEDIAREIWQDKYANPVAMTELSAYTARGVLALYVNDLQRRVQEGSLAKKTVDRRLSDLASFYARRDLEGLLVRDLKRHHATAWLADQANWNATTKHYAAKTIKRAFSWAVDEGHIESNPLAKFSHECGPARQFCVDRPIHDRLMDGASDPKYGRKRVRCFRFVLIALRLSGCRPSEVADMTLDRIDWDNQQWVWSEHKTAKKTGKKRIVTCCPCLWTLTRIAAHGRDRGACTRSPRALCRASSSSAPNGILPYRWNRIWGKRSAAPPHSPTRTVTRPASFPERFLFRLPVCAVTFFEFAFLPFLSAR